MARTFLTVLLVIVINMMVGCHEVDSGHSQLMRPGTKSQPAEIVKTGETDLIECVAADREAYRNALQSLSIYYTQTGNNMKLAWVEDELAGLNKVPQYTYVIDATIAGPNLRASLSITEADYMYQEALRTEKKAKELIFIVDEDKLRLALQRYNNLIRKHPTSDKIDNAAYQAGGIAEHFRDYTVALLYYQRAYQWDANTDTHAEFKAAYLLDTQMARRDEALGLYRRALAKENLSQNYRTFAERRIAELSPKKEPLEESK